MHAIWGSLCFFGTLRLRQKEGVTRITKSKRRRGHKSNPKSSYMQGKTGAKLYHRKIPIGARWRGRSRCARGMTDVHGDRATDLRRSPLGGPLMIRFRTGTVRTKLYESIVRPLLAPTMATRPQTRRRPSRRHIRAGAPRWRMGAPDRGRAPSPRLTALKGTPTVALILPSPVYCYS